MSEELVERIARVETKIDSLTLSVENLTRGIGSRVEQAGKDIVALQERGKNFVKMDDFNVVKNDVNDLNTHKKWIYSGMVGAYIAHFVGWLKR